MLTSRSFPPSSGDRVVECENWLPTRNVEKTASTDCDFTHEYLANTVTQVEWPDPALGPLRPVNRHFPLPGQIGATNQSSSDINAKPEELPHYFGDPLTLLPAQPCERHLGVLAHYLNHELKNSVKDMTEPCENTMPKPSDMLECVAYDCPQILRKDFSDLFPDRDISLGPFTALTLSQRTKNDMSAWSYDVEMEREELLETFNGPHTNASFCETDERYRRLGFQIEDLGCCKLFATHSGALTPM
ncbi:hypothetical protein C0Q70_10180 [Pomacea canaliculata]|uniref:Uncharacterized protein n=1 Tax=Pomacea canaliculata TaxID=400727 RepID=A0A2T7PBW3_POMCA|nr:hypothetical protein C0Q70_10180 [Pomacea canaliculata]